MHQKKGTSVRITFLLLHLSQELQSIHELGHVHQRSKTQPVSVQANSRRQFTLHCHNGCPGVLLLDRRGGSPTVPNHENMADAASPSIQKK